MYSQADTDDLLETASILIEAYIRLNTTLYAQPNFHTLVMKDVTEILLDTLNAADLNDLDDLVATSVEKGMELFYRHIAPPRSNGNSFIRKKPNVAAMQAKISYLQDIPQPEQRTQAWYEFRYKHLTASNIWKTFNSDSTRNQLIYEKCQPLNAIKFSAVNIESPMHWGQKYESVSLQLYAERYQTTVSDFGCLPHKTHSFLAASPDGINTCPSADRYGRMVEVKNIVNREITGNPKLEYWIQMQVQLEVCDLNECDFLETRFIEYTDQAAFELDETALKKGLMMLFMENSGKPIYEYVPLALTLNDYPEWQEAMMEKNKGINWLKNIYWKLDQFSCVLVLRNKLWFAGALPALKSIWQTIESEKITGYAHRSPKKTQTRVKKLPGADEEMNKPFVPLSAKCFITIET